MDLIEMRQKKFGSQYDLAEELGIQQSRVSRWETGNTIPSRKYIFELAKLFDVEPREIHDYFEKEG